jgi:hypothetical protein
MGNAEIVADRARQAITVAEVTGELNFWRLSGDFASSAWFSRAESAPQTSVYGTEGLRFES